MPPAALTQCPDGNNRCSHGQIISEALSQAHYSRSPASVRTVHLVGGHAVANLTAWRAAFPAGRPKGSGRLDSLRAWAWAAWAWAR
jgi:hypothetical protein